MRINDLGLKRCWRCKESKARDQFHKHSGEPDGLCGRCKACVSSDRKQNPERYRKYKHDTHVRSTYGLQPAEYQSMLEKAAGRCEICGASKPGSRKRNFCVDHNHRTGKIRGLLCNRCNRAIGLLGDATTVLHSAISYLETRR